VDCRKIAFAAVVSLAASGKRISVAAYAKAAGSSFQLQPLRAEGIKRSRTGTAIKHRKLATCQDVNALPLIAAPPVENSTAAASSIRRYFTEALRLARRHLFLERFHQSGLYIRRDGLRLEAFVYLDRALSRVQDHPAVGAVGDMLLQLLTNLAIHRIVQELAEFIQEVFTCKQIRRPPCAGRNV